MAALPDRARRTYPTCTESESEPPDDVNDPVQLAARAVEIATRIGVQPQSFPPSTGRTLRPKGTWTFEFLCGAVTEVAAEIGGLFPTHAQLAARGYGHAVQRLKAPGMASAVSGAIGLPLRNQKGLWTNERVIAEHVHWVQAHGGHYPTAVELQADGQLDLASARNRNFVRRQGTLRAEVGRRCGLELPSPQMPPGSYDTQEKLAALLRPLCIRLGRFPTCTEMSAELPKTVFGIVSACWGVRAMAEFMHVPYKGYRSWSKEAALAEFRAKLPRLPQLDGGAQLVITCTAISRVMGNNGIGLMVRYFGNIAGLRSALTSEDGEERKAA